MLTLLDIDICLSYDLELNHGSPKSIMSKYRKALNLARNCAVTFHFERQDVGVKSAEMRATPALSFGFLLVVRRQNSVSGRCTP